MSDLIERQAAIDAVKGLPDCANGYSDTYDKACIIGVLEDVPSAQPERRFDEWCTDCKEYDQEKHCCPRFNRVIRTTLQDVQPERKTGRWIKVGHIENTYLVSKCSVCGYQTIDAGNYCTNCGCKMEDSE